MGTQVLSMDLIHFKHLWSEIWKFCNFLLKKNKKVFADENIHSAYTQFRIRKFSLYKLHLVFHKRVEWDLSVKTCCVCCCFCFWHAKADYKETFFVYMCTRTVIPYDNNILEFWFFRKFIILIVKCVNKFEWRFWLMQ